MENTSGMRQMVPPKYDTLKEAAWQHILPACVPTSVRPSIPAGHHPRATTGGHQRGPPQEATGVQGRRGWSTPASPGQGHGEAADALPFPSLRHSVWEAASSRAPVACYEVKTNDPRGNATPQPGRGTGRDGGPHSDRDLRLRRRQPHLPRVGGEGGQAGERVGATAPARTVPGRGEPSGAEPGGVAGRAGSRRCVPLGMVSKGPLLRLLTAINRRRMKLLMGLAFVAYVACEWAGGGGGGSGPAIHCSLAGG